MVRHLHRRYYRPRYPWWNNLSGAVVSTPEEREASLQELLSKEFGTLKIIGNDANSLVITCDDIPLYAKSLTISRITSAEPIIVTAELYLDYVDLEIEAVIFKGREPNEVTDQTADVDDRLCDPDD